MCAQHVQCYGSGRGECRLCDTGMEQWAQGCVRGVCGAVQRQGGGGVAGETRPAPIVIHRPPHPAQRKSKQGFTHSQAITG